MRARSGVTGVANYSVSENGTLVYVKGSIVPTLDSLVWVDRQGSQEAIAAPSKDYESATLSSDGTRIALHAMDGEDDIWIWDIEREAIQRLTFDPGVNRNPIWSPDGQRVAFTRDVNGRQEISWQAVDGSEGPEPLTESSAASVRPTSFSPDGSALLYMSLGVSSDIWTIPVEGPATAGTPLLVSPANERSASVSPDGQWLAYASDESSEYKIYVRPYPEVDSGGRWEISTGSGFGPLWSRDGRELYYYVGVPGGPDRVMVVSVESGSSFRAGAPEIIFEGEYDEPFDGGQFYDVSLDDQRFLMIRETGGAFVVERAQFVVVQNWFEELNRLVPTGE